MSSVTALYVPGDRPDRFEKAAASGTGTVIIDLEDAVAPEHKAGARAAAAEWITAHALDAPPAIDIRVNAGNAEDLKTVASLDSRVGIRLPKVEATGEVDTVADAVGSRRITALVETARGLERVAEIAGNPRLTGIGLGESDLASDLNAISPLVAQYARVRVILAARAAGLPAPFLSVYPALDDLGGLEADTRAGRAMGFGGRNAAHPKQLAVIEAAFAPAPAEVAWALETVAAVESAGVARLTSGEMADAAMLQRARRILALVAEPDGSRRNHPDPKR